MSDTKINPDSPVASRQVLEMLTVANDFCMFLEKEEVIPRDSLLRYLQKVLPLIYLKASLLPDIIPLDEDAIEHYVTGEQWEDLFNLIRNTLGSDDEYFMVDTGEHSHSDPIKASIAENIADIFQDLKDFVLLYQKPMLAFKENAVRDCRTLFETRYGYCIVNAHKAIHYLLYIKDTGQEYADI
jgi:hypothetical protein